MQLWRKRGRSYKNRSILELIVLRVQVRGNRRLVVWKQTKTELVVATRDLRQQFALCRNAPILARIDNRAVAADFSDVARLAFRFRDQFFAIFHRAGVVYGCGEATDTNQRGYSQK